MITFFVSFQISNIIESKCLAYIKIGSKFLIFKKIHRSEKVTSKSTSNLSNRTFYVD